MAIAKNCRCTMIGDLEDYPDSYNTQRYDNIDGKPVRDMTYQEWYETKKGGKEIPARAVEKPVETVEKPKRKTVSDLGSISEIEELFREQDWFIHGTEELEGWRSDSALSLNGVDVESAKYIFRTYEKFFDRYPQLKNKMAAPITANLARGNVAQVVMGPGMDGLMNINKSSFRDYKKFVAENQRLVKTGYLASPDTIMHELGHAMDNYLTCNARYMGTSGKSFTDFVSNKIRPRVLRNAGVKVGQIIDDVSEYATVNPHEWFAECFTDFMTSENPGKCAIELQKEIDRILTEVSK